MEIVNNEDIPPDIFIEQSKRIERVLELLHNQRKVESLGFEIPIKFKDFWLLCDCPIPYVVRSLKYKNRYIITRDKTTIKGGECMPKDIEMNFVENASIPARMTKKGVAWIELLSKIPVGKSWVVPMAEFKLQTIRTAINQLNAKESLENEYVAIQRSKDKKVQVYVQNLGKRKPTTKPATATKPKV